MFLTMDATHSVEELTSLLLPHPGAMMTVKSMNKCSTIWIIRVMRFIYAMSEPMARQKQFPQYYE
jgi:hypothetical protein